MKQLKALIIHAFADEQCGGNPAGLVLEADELITEQKQEIARQIGLSETAFVSASEVAGFKLEFFTPNKQIPHCGHATIAAFSYLKRINRITGNTSSKETIDGIRQIYFEGEMAFMEQTAPHFPTLARVDKSKALMALGLTENDLLTGHEPEIVNTGNSFLIIPVKHEDLLKNITPDHSLVESLSVQYDLIGFYPFAPTSEQEVIATTRMFAPYYGIAEEAATGMAAGPLVAYLDKYDQLSGDTVFIAQGRFMHPVSPSKIKVQLERREDRIQRLFAGGTAYVAGELFLSLDNLEMV